MARETTLRIVVTIGALAGAIIHVAFPTLVPDTITAVFLIVAILPWFAPLIKSIEVPGWVKIELDKMEAKTDKIEAKAEEATGAAMSASNKADLALTSGVGTSEREVKSLSFSKQHLDELAAEYNRIRDTQKSSSVRTSNMTAVIGKMIQQANGLSVEEIRSALKDTNGGNRLVAYAALYAVPRGELLEELVESVTSIEKTPFGQYWGLQTIGKVIGSTGRENVSIRAVNALRALFAQLHPGSDRYFELNRILEGLKDS